MVRLLRLLVLTCVRLKVLACVRLADVIPTRLSGTLKLPKMSTAACCIRGAHWAAARLGHRRDLIDVAPVASQN